MSLSTTLDRIVISILLIKKAAAKRDFVICTTYLVDIKADIKTKVYWRQLFLVGIHDWPAVSQSRLQTGMRGAFGKPQGTVARVHIGQVIMSIRTKLQNKEHVIEALRRAKFKFPGRQKIHISKKWGFTKFNADEFENMVAEKRLIPDGCGVKYIPNRGPLDKWRALNS
ncbi:60S ribosomal protein L10-like [Cervus canadensis]|uniref:60S ribosomal protein L10-like n=1 Tax=Cervus canadensis TaxID=1574408 RepID=UPI001C9E36ED|nr:60S ribosomal protein L10-like [Cervus canadensis]